MRTFDASELKRIAPLGEGESGTVWKVRDVTTDRVLVQKRLPSSTSRRELMLLARLRHPNIIALEGWGEDEAGAFLLTELCSGDLARIEPGSAGQYLAGALRGLAFLHARGVVHGDLKPQNLLREESGAIVLADFGLASTTGAGDLGGTLAYMAPERLTGSPASTAADLFSLGATFAVALGAPLSPDPRQTADTLRRWLDGRADLVITPLLRKLLSSSPEERPASARAAAKLLAELTGKADDACETTASAASYLRPYRFLQRDGALDALAQAARRPGVVRLRVAPGAGGSRLLEEWALRSQLRLATKDRAYAALTGTPPGTVLAIDDASDADERLPALLIETHRRSLEQEPTPTVVALVRPDDALDRALAAEGCPAVDLAPLALEAFVEIVAAAFPDRGEPTPFAVRLHQICGGSPQRAFSVLSALHEQGRIQPGVLVDADLPGPEALEELATAPFVDGIQRLLATALREGTVERKVAALAACARRPVSEAVATAALNVSISSAVERLRDLRVLATTQALAPDGEHVRAALEALLTPKEREATHRVLADALRSAIAAASPEEALLLRADVAWHRLQIQASDTSAEAVASAKELIERSRPREVISLLRASALDAAGHLLLARALAQVGEFGAAEKEAQTAAEGGADGAAVLLAEILIRRGDYASAVTALERLRRPDDFQAEALLARALALSGQHDRALAVCDAALSRNPSGSPSVDFASTSALAQFYKGDLTAAVARYEAARDAAKCVGDKAREANATNGIGLVAHRRAAFDVARERYAEALKLGEEAGDRARIGTSHLNLGTVLQELGRSREAAQEYRRSASTARLIGERVQSARARSNLANLLMYVGRLEEARGVAEESRSLAEMAGAGVVTGYALLLLGELDLLQGRPSEAEQRLGRVRDLFEGMGNTAEALEAETLRARALLATGESAKATAVARDAAAKAREKGLDRHEAQAWLAVVEGMVTHDGPADGALAAAHRAMSLALQAKRPDVVWRLEAALALASEAAAQPHFAARALAALQAAAGAIDPEDKPTFLARSDRSKLRSRLQGMIPAVSATTDQRLSRLLAVNRRLGTERNLKALLESIVDEAVELCGAERGFVLLAPEKAGAAIDVMVARNIDRESLSKGAMKVSHSIAERVISEGEPELTLDAQEDERYQQQLSVSALKLRSVLCVPLRLQGRVLGALYIDNRFRARAFGNEDLTLLESFADQASIAMGQVRALEDARRAREEADQARKEIESLNEKLSERVVAQEAEIMRARREADEQRLAVGPNPFANIVGESAPMLRMIKQLTRVANTDLTVLITGESGTGKELVARALFSQGPRRDRPFVSINCAALNEGLLESELFGHIRGAFTGADRDRDGLFQVADTGTLFLDEVGDMGLTMQAKLLRALQEGEIRKVGSQKAVKVDVRVIAATNRDLPQLIKEGKFREDLYYRLNVVSLFLPPLRERTGDLPLLCARLLADIGPREDGKPYRLASDALSLLSRHAWPGNIRELRATLHNAALFAESDLLTARDFATKFSPARSAVAAEQPVTLQSIQDDAIIRALQAAKGNKSEAARALGIDRKTLYNRLARLPKPLDS